MSQIAVVKLFSHENLLKAERKLSKRTEFQLGKSFRLYVTEDIPFIQHLYFYDVPALQPCVFDDCGIQSTE